MAASVLHDPLSKIVDKQKLQRRACRHVYNMLDHMVDTIRQGETVVREYRGARQADIRSNQRRLLNLLGMMKTHMEPLRTIIEELMETTELLGALKRELQIEGRPRPLSDRGRHRSRTYSQGRCYCGVSAPEQKSGATGTAARMKPKYLPYAETIKTEDQKSGTEGSAAELRPKCLSYAESIKTETDEESTPKCIVYPESIKMEKAEPTVAQEFKYSLLQVKKQPPLQPLSPPRPLTMRGSPPVKRDTDNAPVGSGHLPATSGEQRKSRLRSKSRSKLRSKSRSKSRSRSQSVSEKYPSASPEFTESSKFPEFIESSKFPETYAELESPTKSTASAQSENTSPKRLYRTGRSKSPNRSPRSGRSKSPRRQVRIGSTAPYRMPNGGRGRPPTTPKTLVFSSPLRWARMPFLNGTTLAYELVNWGVNTLADIVTITTSPFRRIGHCPGVVILLILGLFLLLHYTCLTESTSFRALCTPYAVELRHTGGSPPT